MRPMPFWPSLEPWAKLTPVQVQHQQSPDPQWRRCVTFRRLEEFAVHFSNARMSSSSKPASDESDEGREHQRLHRVLTPSPS